MKRHDRYKLQEDADRLREMRMHLGISQTEICKAIKMNSSHYSEIEAGRLSAVRALTHIKPLFEEWREKQIEKLQLRIDYLKSL